MGQFRFPRFATQILITILAGLGLIWIQRFLNPESVYVYFLSSPIPASGFMALGVAALLLPQIFRVFQVVFRQLAALLFYSIYRTRNKKRKVASLIPAIFLACLLATGLTSLVLGTLNLIFSLVREVKYAHEINRQLLVERANEEEKDGVGTNLSTLQQIIRMYPDDRRNAAIKYRIARLKSAQQLSAHVFGNADKLREGGYLIIAAETYSAALRIWPPNNEAWSAISALQDAADKARPELTSLFSACRHNKKIDPSTISAVAGFIFREPNAILKKIEAERPLDRHSSIGLLACNAARTSGDSDEFYLAIRNDLTPGEEQ